MNKIWFGIIFSIVYSSVVIGETRDIQTECFGTVTVGGECPSYICSSIPGDIGYSWDTKADESVQVKINACEEQSPAYFQARWIPIGRQNVSGTICGQDAIYDDVSGSDYLNIWCDFDPNVFVVSSNRGLRPFDCTALGSSSPFAYFSRNAFKDIELKNVLTIGVTERVIIDEKFRNSVKNEKVKIYAENCRYPTRVPTWTEYNWLPTPICLSGTLVYEDKGEIATVGMEINDGDSSCASCAGGNSGGGPGGGPKKLPVLGGNYNAPITNRQDTTLNMFAKINYPNNPEINLPGFWLKPGGVYNSWSSSLSYPKDSSQKITKVSLEITSPQHMKYCYSLTGLWETEAIARIQSAGKIRLDCVKDINDQVVLSYDYSSGDKITITGNKNGQPSYYVIYDGGVDDSNPSDTLKRIWMGTNINDYQGPESAQNPAAGRWVDLTTELQPVTGIPMIKEVSTCSECSGIKQKLDYVPALTNMKFPLHGEMTDKEPTNYLVGQVRDAADNVLVKYNYDSSDRVSKKYLGNYQKPVFEIKRENKELKLNDPSLPGYDPSKSQGFVMMGNQDYAVQKDYVNDTQFRVTERLYDEAKGVTKERKYHDLQTSQWFTGPYSETIYATEIMNNGYITKKTIILPSKDKVYEYYTKLEGGVGLEKRIRGGVTEVFNSYTIANNKPVVAWSVNERGVTTHYAYDVHGNVISRVDPAPGVFGKTGTEHRLTTHYRYDAYDRITLEWANDGKAATIYEYDEFGNLTLQAKGTVIYPSGIPIGQKGNLQSRYEYNEYNEQTLSYDCDTSSTPNQYRNIRRTFYSNSGVVIAEASYKDKDSTANAINAVYYIYDSNGRLVTKKTAHKDTAFSFNGADPEGGTPGSSWIKEVYQYDAYGRKTAVIADAGTGGKNLTTTYEYNNQSEVERVTTPDMHYTQTIRDGRGLVSEVITGVKVDGQYEARATTNYYYDLNGNLIKKKDPTGVCDCYAYDALGRRTRTWRTNE
jgi:YD repeat-containing protein